MNELARVVAEAMDRKYTVEYLDPRNEVKVAFSDHAKAEAAFGRRQKTSLEDGLRSMAQWVGVHGARQSSVFENIEIAKNMPPSWSSVLSAVS